MRKLTIAITLAAALLSAPAAHADIVSDFTPAPGKCLNGGHDTFSEEHKVYFLHSGSGAMLFVVKTTSGDYMFKDTTPPHPLLGQAGNLEGAQRLLKMLCE